MEWNPFFSLKIFTPLQLWNFINKPIAISLSDAKKTLLLSIQPFHGNEDDDDDDPAAAADHDDDGQVIKTLSISWQLLI